MRDRARADIADQRHPAGRMARPAAADQPRRLDAEIFGDDRDLLRAQAPRAVQQIGDGGGRTTERLAKPLRVLRVCLRPSRIQSTVMP